MNRIPLSALMAVPPQQNEAKVIAKPTKASKSVVARSDNERTRYQLQGRMVAMEMIANGGDFQKAYAAVPGMRARDKRKAQTRTPEHLFHPIALDSFSRALKDALDVREISKDQALALLWTQTMSSPLDFYDDNGVAMSIAELKQLPALVRAIITEVRVETHEEVLVDAKGQPILDSKGDMQKLAKQVAVVKIADKNDALRQIAQIMKWVGPTVQINADKVSMATIVGAAESRASRLGAVYDQVETDNAASDQ